MALTRLIVRLRWPSLSIRASPTTAIAATAAPSRWKTGAAQAQSPGTYSSRFVLLAGAHTRPLSLLLLEYANAGRFEEASVIGVILSVIALTVTAIVRQSGFSSLAFSEGSTP